MKLRQIMLRDLFWLVLVCAICLGWWLTALDWARLLEENQRRADEQQRANARLAFSWLQNHAPEGTWKVVEITYPFGETHLLPAASLIEFQQLNFGISNGSAAWTASE